MVTCVHTCPCAQKTSLDSQIFLPKSPKKTINRYLLLPKKKTHPSTGTYRTYLLLLQPHPQVVSLVTALLRPPYPALRVHRPVALRARDPRGRGRRGADGAALRLPGPGSLAEGPVWFNGEAKMFFFGEEKWAILWLLDFFGGFERLRWGVCVLIHTQKR